MRPRNDRNHLRPLGPGSSESLDAKPCDDGNEATVPPGRADRDLVTGEGQARPPEPPRSRTSLRREEARTEAALMELASSLADSSDRLLAKLELPERVLLLIQEARRIQVSAARNRALRRVRIALRDADATSIRERLSDLRNPAHDGTAGAVLDRWRERLVSGGQVAVAEFLNAFPGANRRQLEQRLRNVRKATESTRAQRLRSLNKALRDAIACRASISRFGVAEIG